MRLQETTDDLNFSNFKPSAGYISPFQDWADRFSRNVGNYQSKLRNRRTMASFTQRRKL